MRSQKQIEVVEGETSCEIPETNRGGGGRDVV